MTKAYRQLSAVPLDESAKVSPPFRWSRLKRWWKSIGAPSVKAEGHRHNTCKITVGGSYVQVFWTRIVAMSASLDAFDDGHEFVIRGEGDETLIVPIGTVPELRRLLHSLARAWEVTGKS